MNSVQINWLPSIEEGSTEFSFSILRMPIYNPYLTISDSTSNDKGSYVIYCDFPNNRYFKANKLPG